MRLGRTIRGNDTCAGMMRALPSLPFPLLAAALASLVLAACGAAESEDAEPAARSGTTTGEQTTEAGSTTSEAPTTTRTKRKAGRLPGVPASLAAYRNWTRLNARPVPPRDSDPHFGTKNVYASKPAGPGGRYPDGTVIVKDAVAPGEDFVRLIAVMRKETGADPEHGDWLFVEYTRDAAADRFEEIASGAVCWSCHVGAAETDWVWIAKLGLTR